MKNCIGYTRVSTKDQAINGTSLISQNEFIQQCAKLNGLQLDSILSDEGISASSTKRPSFDAVMSMVKSKSISAVIVYSVSRFARNTRQLLAAVDLMEKNNVRFISCKENIDTQTAVGKFFLTVLAALAELESAQTGERITDVKAKNKESGRTYSSAIYGYDNTFEVNADGKRVNGRLVANDELSLVKQIIADAKIKSFGQIASELNDALVRTKKNKKWHRSTVSNIVNNPVYNNCQ